MKQADICRTLDAISHEMVVRTPDRWDKVIRLAEEINRSVSGDDEVRASVRAAYTYASYRKQNPQITGTGQEDNFNDLYMAWVTRYTDYARAHCDTGRIQPLGELSDSED